MSSHHQFPNLPNFFILGAAKCGTTTLQDIVAQHPGIYMTREKEPRFFDADQYFSKGIQQYLADHFSAASEFEIRGEATPHYFHRGDVTADRILSCCGSDLRFVLILRDPVARAWSHYLHMRRIGAEPESFEHALDIEAERLKNKRHAWVGYFSDGLYASQLDIWLDKFDRSRFLFLLDEELRADPAGKARTVFSFLGADTVVANRRIA